MKNILDYRLVILDNNDKQWFQCMDNVSDYFSLNIIQSYYSKKKR